MKTRIGALLLFLLIGWSFPAEDYTQWRYYRTVTVNTSSTGAVVSGTKLKFPLLVRLNSTNFDFTKALHTGADIRFAKKNGSHLPYQVERWDSTAKTAEIWVLADTIVGNGNTAVRIYYGKLGSADSSNGKMVFDTANGFQGVFHLTETTNDTVWDVTANRFKGLPRNVGGQNPQDTNGVIGKGKKFLGNTTNSNGGCYRLITSSGGNTYTSNPLNFQNDSATRSGLPLYTLSSWIYVSEFPTNFPSGKSTRRPIIAKSRGVSGQQYVLRVVDPAVDQLYSPVGDSNQVQFSDGVTATYKDFPTKTGGPSNFPPNKWFYLTAVRSGSLGSASSLRTCLNYKCFNGSASITTTTRSDYSVYIGSYSNDSAFFNGMLDEVRFENVARDSMWIRLNYWTQRPDSNAVTVGSETTVGLNPVNPALKNAMTGSWMIHVKGPKSFSFRLSNSLTATMTVENMDGRIVWSRTTRPDQNGQVFWNGRNENGQPLSPGMYVVRLNPSGGQ